MRGMVRGLCYFQIGQKALPFDKITVEKKTRRM